MAVLKNTDGTEFLVDCCCGCDEGIRLRINKNDFDYYSFLSYTSGHFYREQTDNLLMVFCKKLKKIWAIIRNKDFYYSEVTMTKDQFNEFREYINSI